MTIEMTTQTPVQFVNARRSVNRHSRPTRLYDGDNDDDDVFCVESDIKR